MNEAAVRLPSALFGFLSVILFYFYIRAITKNDPLAVIATALLAINPWHVFYSRGTFEVTIALFLFLAGVLCLHKRKLLISVVFFLAAFYTYNLTRLLAPVLFVLFMLNYYKETHTISKKEIIAAAMIGILGLMPFILSLTSNGGAASAAGTLITTSAAVQAPLVEFRSYMISQPALIAKLLFNSWMLTLWQYINNVASYFSVSFFFLTGSSHGNHGIGTAGLFYLTELPLFLLGIFAFFREKSSWARHLIIWASATIGISALTREAPHATRSFFLIVPVITLIAWGFLAFRRKLFIMSICALLLWNCIFYFSSYFIRFPVAYAKSWRSADKDLSLFIKNEESKYDQIIFNKQAGFIYSSLLFYTGYAPEKFQTTAEWSPDDSEGFSDLLSFGKYQFKDVDWGVDYGPEKKTLIITKPDRIPTNVTPLKTFYYPKKPVVFALKQEIVRYPIDEIAYVTVASP